MSRPVKTPRKRTAGTQGKSSYPQPPHPTIPGPIQQSPPQPNPNDQYLSATSKSPPQRLTRAMSQSMSKQAGRNNDASIYTLENPPQTSTPKNHVSSALANSSSSSNDSPTQHMTRSQTRKMAKQAGEASSTLISLKDPPRTSSKKKRDTREQPREIVCTYKDIFGPHSPIDLSTLTPAERKMVESVDLIPLEWWNEQTQSTSSLPGNPSNPSRTTGKIISGPSNQSNQSSSSSSSSAASTAQNKNQTTTITIIITSGTMTTNPSENRSSGRNNITTTNANDRHIIRPIRSFSQASSSHPTSTLTTTSNSPALAPIPTPTCYFPTDVTPHPHAATTNPNDDNDSNGATWETRPTTKQDMLANPWPSHDLNEPVDESGSWTFGSMPNAYTNANRNRNGPDPLLSTYTNLCMDEDCPNAENSHPEGPWCWTD